MRMILYITEGLMRFADYDITPSPLPNDGLMFADLVAKGRSGHLGHALV